MSGQEHTVVSFPLFFLQSKRQILTWAAVHAHRVRIISHTEKRKSDFFLQIILYKASD